MNGNEVALDTNQAIAVLNALIHLQLRRRGRPIPENDVWIAALCVEHKMPLATSDEHFLEVDALQLIRR